ncbi:MAG TPA: NAD(P)-binding protein [Solirubrobacterales bacterium]|nr:NAD(P)-binding protein [Solirubrobacterales bacterium]
MGAGLSGLAAARALSARGVPFDCFDRRSAVGGVCRSEMAPRLDVSKRHLQFSDWPMPGSYPRLPAPRHLASYLSDYAERFDLRPHLRLRTEVRRASRRPEGGWEVELEGGERRSYSALAVAAGRRGRSRPRSLPGSFAGEEREGWPPPRREQLRGRDVVVVGDGPEAYEAATTASYVACSTSFSTRRPRYPLPQVVLGRPLDDLPGLDYLRGRPIGRGAASTALPRPVRQGALRALYGRFISPRSYGLPEPREPLADAGAMLAPQLLERLLHGRIDVKPAVTRLAGDQVVFADGSAARADLVVWFGNRPHYPFLAEVDLTSSGGEPLLGACAGPDLFFLGLVEPVAGSPTAVAEVQASWLAAQLAGEYASPRPAGPGTAPRGLRLKRVEQHEYRRQVEREVRAGRRRARSLVR